MIHVLVGTKAEYIKMAPVLRVFDQRGVAYRLIDTGQHGSSAGGLRRELNIRDPDFALGIDRDVVSIPQAIAWSSRLVRRLARRTDLRSTVFGDQPGLCLVHGDTPSTLLSTLLARRAGLEVTHVEAGLRSYDFAQPFPEELIRVAVMRLSQRLFASDQAALRNLRAMGIRGEVIPLAGNTTIDSLEFALSDYAPGSEASVIVTMHRVENLHRRRRVEGLVALVERIAAEWDVRFILHPPTNAAIRSEQRRRLLHAGVEIGPLVSHARFVSYLDRAPFVVTDGGSIQEECALLGVPTLLWRARTERSDGLGANAVLSGYDTDVIDRFVANPGRYRRPATHRDTSPSEEIVDVILSRVGGQASLPLSKQAWPR